jgi:hypothetical protein
MRLHNHSLSKISLFDVLRKRRTNLKKFLEDSGIVTYELLTARCASMGVLPPDEKAFIEAKGFNASEPPTISSPTEGLLVLEPPHVVEESTGKNIYVEDREAPQVEVQVIIDSISSEESASQQTKKSKKAR